jgi:hypothetical protein
MSPIMGNKSSLASPLSCLRDDATSARSLMSWGADAVLAVSPIAIHESGHAIVSRWLGLPIGGATIMAADDDDYGGITFGPGADRLNVTRASLREEAQRQCDGATELLPPAGERRDSTTTWWVYAQSQILGLMAGFAAEELAGLSRDLEAQSTDMEIARIYGRTCFGSEDGVASFMAACRADATKILKDHWSAVEAVAAALDEKKTLDGVEIDAIIFAAEGKAAHETELRRREAMLDMLRKVGQVIW